MQLIEAGEMEDIDLQKVPVTISVGKKAPVEHRRLANKLGCIGGIKISAIELAEYLKKNHYSVYPMESVNRYMAGKVKEINDQRKRGTAAKAWRWIPLRKAQAVKQDRYDRTTTLYYRHTVPVEVLMTVEKIFDELGDQVIFEITDVYTKVVKETVSADPFLAVTAPGCARFVLERWDEPGYRS
jgi:hypothetical protein